MKIAALAGYACLLIISSCSLPSNKQESGVQNSDIGIVKDEDIPLPQKSETNNQQQAPYKKVLADTGTVQSSANINTTDWHKKIIKNANIELKLKDYKSFNDNLHNEIKRFGAYISNEQQSETDYKIENITTIKVPVDQFDNLVNSFSKADITIVSKNISAEDVTGQAVDAKARMQSRMAVRDRYTDLLKQAKSMKEVLDIQNEINDIQEDVEAAGSRLNYLQHASAYSTINVTYFQLLKGSYNNSGKPDFINRVAHAFTNGVSLIGNLFIVLITIWPLLLILLITFIFIKRWKSTKAVVVK